MPEPSDQPGVTTLEATVRIRRGTGTYDASTMALDALRKKVCDGRYVVIDHERTLYLGGDVGGEDIELTAAARVIALDKVLGAVDGPPGPSGPQHRSTPHVYARHPASGSGNCVCGAALADWVHTEAAPGVPIPETMRRG